MGRRPHQHGSRGLGQRVAAHVQQDELRRGAIAQRNRQRLVAHESLVRV